MPKHTLLNDEQIIHDSIKAISTIPQSKIELRLHKSRGPFSGTFRLSGPWGERYYYIKVVPKLSPQLVDLVIHQIKTSPAPQNSKPLLVSHYISPKMAAQLKQQKIEYADSAGNIFLNQLPLYVEIDGKKHPQKPAGADRLFRHAGLKLIYLLLRNHTAVNTTYRALADDAGIALGAIGHLLGELEKRGNVTRNAQGKRQLQATEELLQRWQLGYLETLRQKLLLQRCQLSPGETIEEFYERLQSLPLSKQVLIGGELGAALMVNGFKPHGAVLYLPPEQQLETIQQLRLCPDPAGKITLLQPFGHQCLWSGRQSGGITFVDPLLTFAELKGSNTDRIAGELYQRYLLPRWSESD